MPSRSSCTSQVFREVSGFQGDRMVISELSWNSFLHFLPSAESGYRTRDRTGLPRDLNSICQPRRWNRVAIESLWILKPGTLTLLPISRLLPHIPKEISNSRDALIAFQDGHRNDFLLPLLEPSDVVRLWHQYYAMKTANYRIIKFRLKVDIDLYR